MIEPAKAENKGLTRRRLLKKIGIAGFSGVAVASGTTLAEQVTEDRVEVWLCAEYFQMQGLQKMRRCLCGRKQSGARYSNTIHTCTGNGTRKYEPGRIESLL